MEVYKILCKTNKKIYIGSSIYNKEHRWNNLRSGHLCCAINNNDKRPLYQDIRNYGAEDFVLTTLEVLDEGSQYDIQVLEDKWIKKFWDESNGLMMYNAMRSAWNDTKLLHTREVVEKQLITNKRNNGGILAYNTVESRIKNDFVRSKKFIINEKVLAVSIGGLFNILIELGYNVTHRQVSSLASNSGINYKVLNAYPELCLSNPDCIFREINNEEFYKLRGEIE